MQRLKNDIKECEEGSDRLVSPSSHYVVKIRVDTTESLVKTVKLLARREFGDDHRPLIAYLYGGDAYFVFSSLENGSHFLGGSHHRLVSHFTSYFARTFGCDIECSIVEIDTRMRILIYFQTKVYDNTRSYALSKVKTRLSETEKGVATVANLIERLKDSGIIWDDIPTHERHGTFYKFTAGNDGKERFVTLSELINIQTPERYLSYIFG